MKNNRPKIIGIDFRPALSEKAGIGVYTRNLVKSLIENDSTHEYVLFSDKDFDLNTSAGKYKKIIYNSPIPKLNSFVFHLKTILFSTSLCTQYLSTSSLFVPAFRKNFATIVIHDLTSIKYPYLHNFKTRLLNKLLLKLAVKNALSVIAVSKSTKDDLLEYFKDCPEEKITAIHEGVDINLQKNLSNQKNSIWNDIKLKYGISKDYILFIGTIEPRKNIINLIKAFENISDQTLQLVIVGRKGWHFDDIFEYVQNMKDYKKKSNVIFTGTVSEDEKAYILKYAQIFVYPSLYEGFGLPLLEAMLFQVPFISSNVSSIPEVAGNAGLLIDPLNIEDISNSITKLLSDKELYESFKQKETEQLRKFDWRKISDEVKLLFC